MQNIYGLSGFCELIIEKGKTQHDIFMYFSALWSSWAMASYWRVVVIIEATMHIQLGFKPLVFHH